MRVPVLFMIVLIQSGFAVSATAGKGAAAHSGSAAQAESASGPVEGLKADGSLDRSKISKAYFEGDFDKVVTALEAWRKLQPNPSKEDKIYAYKYLSVIYAAKPETRGKAESFMYQLLKLMPSIELMDLYISDNIEAIFNSVRLRFEQQSKYAPDSGQGNRSAPAATSAASGNGLDGKRPVPANGGSGSNPEKGGKENPTGKSNSHWGLWTAGVVGIAVVAAGYFVLSAPVRTASAPPDSIIFK